jgi:hypothetical protein
MKLNTFNQKTKGLKAFAVMVIAVVGSFLTAGSAKAVLQSFSFNNGAGLSAAADFNIVGNNLTLELTNTGSADANAPGDVLTAVFFNIAGNPLLTPVSALLGPTTNVVYDPDGQPAGGNVGGEWAYGRFLASTNPFGTTQGVSSAGFNIFGQANFNGPDLSSPTAVNGVNYGILPGGWSPLNDNGGLTGSGGLIAPNPQGANPQVNPSVVFNLGAFPTTGVISNVFFQYGTSLTEFNSVPDGGTTLMLLGSALACLGVLRRRFC